ncbi:TRAP transporter substrate-binding protein DctP [Orrella marina]|uniref:TRAP transporter substrate-binding protein DctP n=1 Tax=Orrella marina TaxID=2163011 RepID=A0A2R4XKZ5_9BURK|nr:TRAP transporter substrate-binding protein DctP [Orrella marina]AWB34451.1 TRAP transporter substrate-binding protein DctP [Orrella marina]
MSTLRRKFIGTTFAALAAVFVATPASAQEKLRIALDTNPVHVRNKGVDLFVEELKKRTGDHFAIEVYPSGQLFRDRDVPRALRQGALEMGVPGIWQLDASEPNAALVTLPMFYGVPADTVYNVMDGDLGTFLNRKFEERMRVKIPGKWMALGMQNTFGVSQPIDYQTYKGKKIRYPSGTGNAARIDKLGGIGILVPWPDVPLAMSQGVMDGLLTTFESASSSKLMDSGMQYAFEDQNMFNQYVPMFSDSFWRKQPEDIKAAILDAWDVAATWQRAQAFKAQDHAKDTMVKAGLTVIVPTPEQIANARRELMTIQDQLIDSMKIDKEVAKTTLEALKAAGVSF